MQYQTITKKNIRVMVDRFYSSVLKDDLIADFFIEKLGDEMISDEWQHHLNLLTDFWAAMTTGDNSYNGTPITPHLDMPGLNKESFQRWLELFSETIDRLYEKKAADIFKIRGEMIANNFMKQLKL
ncbi:group III truncated hemoglobin [Sulfurimonas sp. NW7]|uniref:group III truncated hemoglobin n=1 Tax=unclassified Sulfurimonas TaxID=2623549 RepID=UPI003DA9E004